jgi:hypothetical protein
MADENERTPEQLQAEMFADAQLAPQLEPAPAPEPSPAPAPAPAVPTPDPEANIPSWRLREESEARRLAENNARQLAERLAGIEASLRREEKPPDFFENPDQAAQALLMKTLQPFAEETRKTLMHMGRMLAYSTHGQDKVLEAEKAFIEAKNNESLDVADYEKVVTSPNRYDEVVKWHRRHEALKTVGDDPSAWFESQLTARLADPAFAASLIEKVRGGAAVAQPTAVRLPPSLSKSTAATGNGVGVLGDLSDKSLFEYASGKFERPG